MDYRRRKRRHTRRRLRQKQLRKRTRRVRTPRTPTPARTPNTPITRRAKELGTLYPNRASMLARSNSMPGDGLTTEEFYDQFEQLFPEQNES